MGCGSTWEDGGGWNIFVRKRNQREIEMDGNAVVHRINTAGGVGIRRVGYGGACSVEDRNALSFSLRIRATSLSAYSEGQSCFPD